MYMLDFLFYFLQRGEPAKSMYAYLVAMHCPCPHYRE